MFFIIINVISVSLCVRFLIYKITYYPIRVSSSKYSVIKKQGLSGNVFLAKKRAAVTLRQKVCV